jgi:alpha-tubulin suppressor-like RCC1 family protein
MAVLTESGDVMTYGSNQFGQLGTNNEKSNEFNNVRFHNSSEDPQPISHRMTVQDITCGYQHMICHMTDGTFYACGRRNWFQYKPLE